MKKIYVVKDMFGGFRGISKEEADGLVNGGKAFGVVMEVDRGDDILQITLLKQSALARFGASDEMIQQLSDEYFKYVEEITGMVSFPAKEL